MSAAQASGDEPVAALLAQAGGNGASGLPVISADGRFVAFVSEASNLVRGDANHFQDVFVRDRAAGRTERASVSNSGAEVPSPSADQAMSGDGRFVAFSSASAHLVADDANKKEDAFVRGRAQGTTERVSLTSSGGEANGNSGRRDLIGISSDGRFVAFSSAASNLVAGDSNSRNDVFVRDRVTGTTERVSVSSSGAQGNSHSVSATISADGRFVAFVSDASTLSPTTATTKGTCSCATASQARPNW